MLLLFQLLTLINVFFQAILPAEAKACKKRNVIGCWLGQGLTSAPPRYSLTVLDLAIKDVIDPVVNTGR